MQEEPKVLRQLLVEMEKQADRICANSYHHRVDCNTAIGMAHGHYHSETSSGLVRVCAFSQTQVRFIHAISIIPIDVNNGIEGRIAQHKIESRIFAILNSWVIGARESWVCQSKPHFMVVKSSVSAYPAIGVSSILNNNSNADIPIRITRNIGVIVVGGILLPPSIKIA